VNDLELLCAVAAGPGYHVREHDWPAGERNDRVAAWLPAEDWRRTAASAALWADYGASVSLCAYASRGSYRRHALGSCLWTRVDTGRSWDALRRFEPAPSLVLQLGRAARYIAVWALRKPLLPEDVERANRRLAHAFGGMKKWGGLDFRCPVPGAVLREGRKRPVVVSVVSRGEGLYAAGAVVRRLKDAPDPNAWRQREAAA
jgi:hypothetical protein